MATFNININDNNDPISDPSLVNNFTGFSELILDSSQVITANTWTQINFTGGRALNNGGLQLLESDGKISPITVNDVIQCDIKFQFIITNNNDYIVVRLREGSNILGSNSINFLRNSGTVETFRISYNIPVYQSLLDNKGIWEIYCNNNININNKYTSVTRVHKSI